MRKVGFTAALIILVALLAGCGVSQENRDACENDGGVVISQRFVYKTSDSFFYHVVRTGKLNFCEVGGSITDVYNKEITSPTGGLFGPSQQNVKIFEECKAMEGRVYKTSVSSGKQTYVRWACVQGGEYVQILE